jgi:large subunit ribosomal protein L25
LSKDQIAVTLEERTTVGKGLGQLKRDGKVPVVVHNHGQESVIAQGNYMDLVKLYNKAGKHHAIDVTVGDQKFLTIIKDVSFEPKKHKLRHLVFGAIRQNEEVETEVPIVFDGDAPAERASLLVIRQLDHVQVKGLPRDLIDEIRVSVEGLVEIGDKISVADLQIPEGITVLTEAEHGIAIVEETPAQVSEEAEEEAAEGEAGAEGEGGEAVEGQEGSDDKGDSKSDENQKSDDK